MVGSEADGAPPVSTGRTLVTGEQPPVAEVVRPPVGEPTRPKLVDQRNDTSEIQQLATGGVRQVTGEVRHLTGEMKPITGQGQSEGPPPVGDAKLPDREPPLPPAAPPPALPGEVLLPSTRQWLAPDPDADAEVEAAEAEVEAAADANAHADRDAGSATETGVRDPFPKDFDAE
jgi:hypothetical protein